MICFYKLAFILDTICITLGMVFAGKVQVRCRALMSILRKPRADEQDEHRWIRPSQWTLVLEACNVVSLLAVMRETKRHF